MTEMLLFTFETTYGLCHHLRNVFLPCMMSMHYQVDDRVFAHGDVFISHPYKFSEAFHQVNSLIELFIKQDLC